MKTNQFTSRFSLVFGAVIALTLAACGSSKTQEKIDVANSDYQRLRVIDLELQADGVNVNAPHGADDRIERMEPAKLDRVRGLLTEFIGRGDNIVATAQRKDVKVTNGGMAGLELALRRAGQLKLKVLETIGRPCANGRSISIARQAALAYVGTLGSRVVDQIDARSADPETVSCGVTRFVFTSRKDPSCTLGVLVDHQFVRQGESDTRFSCARR